MTQVCQWLGYYLCMRSINAPKSDTIHPNTTVFDAVIVWKEAAKEKSGGLAYEVILKPATKDNLPRPQSPPEKNISQEYIERKLAEAEARRLHAEQAKLALINKGKARQAEAVKKVESLSLSFSKETEEKLESKLESVSEKKEAKIQALQERLRDHATQVQNVRASYDACSDAQCQEILQCIEKKLTLADENRQSKLKNIQGRQVEHEKHVSQVLDASNDASHKFSQVTEEKLIMKMETTLKNRETQLRHLMARLSDHERRGDEVREQKLNRSQTEATS